MTKGIKIVTIGGGSSYTPELMEGFIKRYEELPIREMWLVDIEDGKEKLEIVGKMAQRMWDASPYDVKVHLTLDRREALKDADFVTTQFRVGLLNARIKDERIPLSYGMAGQETNGAGGIFKAFRTIPIILSIVEDMKELCPNAWLINFTNPSGMVTDAIIRYGKWEKVIGLCNVPVNAMIAEPELIGKNLDELIYTFAGLNHFHWHRVKDLTGNDVTSEIIDKLYDGDSGIPSNIFDVPFFKEQLKQMNMIPCGYHRYYYRYDEMLEHMLEEYNDSNVGTRAQQVKQTEAELFELYKDPNLNYKPEQLAKRGGAHYSDAACETIASIYANKNTHIVVSTKNNGAVPDLAPDDVVEVSAYIGAAGARPIAFGTLQPAERGWLQVMKNMELCVEEAAVTGDYGLALQAFIINPLIPSGETAKRVLDELLIAHKRYLPQFAEKIAELEAVGITVKDEIARNLY
ncbi:6-phospho-beta-glucosidase [Bacillus toyonensis]|uniref:6-phospho-beta-glucosidase n=1 Tax=Bacillus thuringiensis serovar mexicanensis TaxID=180868 RepID=A0A242VZD2_BACTU|nr:MULTISPECIES: 6-phospho-beta-glucosidase [Bacillus cereus group]AFU17563.1 Alpha-galactosidase [Bacillus thuringiensis MC28]EEM55900.1 Alpha-galactosidase [Bacillus thuringiensis serovar monterrey BGSC 4AJ1]MEB9670255.1 6-phospho-beta-glucosidase [Bacillus anthracis]MED3542393.1 6-phospho-beta-glucosidase [Bacillus toyonensis]MEE2021795.1 6-phospho-beta-glucosidase [Bacillus toyonensis]